ncbi:hypothetical protein LENED_008734 [Lentinula edodes]|uniref:Uncharacterized protein n=1 Tax=Lentinula edodes TaxID=5353 RepID=A0A1Q3EHT8_LENED|nr:hypothetical protein LENED_008734 [Lentinula edodes]
MREETTRKRSGKVKGKPQANPHRLARCHRKSSLRRHKCTGATREGPLCLTVIVTDAYTDTNNAVDGIGRRNSAQYTFMFKKGIQTSVLVILFS